MKKHFLAQIMFALFVALLLLPASGCKKTDIQPDIPPPVPEEEISGTLEISDGSTVQANELKVVSFTGMGDISNDGSFSVSVAGGQRNQLVFFNSDNDEPVYIGIYNPVNGTLTANETSTALALTMFNPYLIYSDQSQREEYLEKVRQNPKFDQLVSRLHEAYTTDAEMALDYEKNPEIYQLTVYITKETLESFGYFRSNYRGVTDPPYIEDVAGPKIKFVNKRHVWYAAGIHPNGQELKEVKTVDRRKTIVSFQLGWPPVVLTDPAETEYELGDGTFKIQIARGFDFSKFFEWNDPAGRGTVLNTGQCILYVIDIVVGFVPLPDVATLPQHFHISANDAYSMTRNIAQGDAQGFLLDFFKLIGSNKEELSYWLFQSGSTAPAHYLKSLSGLFKNVALVFKIMGLANEQAPFIVDLVFAPKDVTYFVTQQNGVITSSTQNDSPMPVFIIDPPAGVVGTNFVFDASETTDDNDMLSQIRFRWDFEGNGNWTSWSGSPVMHHSYSLSGSYQVVMEAKDTDGQVSSVAHVLNVGGGAGTATHVKLFMDDQPWNSNAMIDMLVSLGFTNGTGNDTYEIISSGQMGSVELIPGEDLVIISNDQPQYFYNNYAANEVKFTNFVYMGGSMFWEACDEGWNDGSINSAGITLPGNISITYDEDYYNYVVNQNLPLVAGLPDEMDHNYASHEYFSNLPDGSIIYCVNSNSKPTLVEFNLGEGWLLMTGQPLEHQYEYIYGNPDMEELLPRIVGYFTNKTPVIKTRNLLPSVKPTSLSNKKQ